MRKIGTTLIVAALVLAACGSDDDDSADSATSSTAGGPTTTATTSSTTAPCPPLAGGTTSPTNSAAASGAGTLTDVGLTTGDCTDAVAFTFEATAADAPGYRVEYVPGPITQDASDAPVDVAGGAYLAVRFEPARGYDVETGAPTYTGPNRLDPTGAFFVKDVVRTGDFEGVVTWVIGVDQQRPYTVTTAGTSTRTVTIEIR